MFLTLTELRYIIALAQERHFGKAAQKCFVSQPTLSIAIKKLEENLGIMIFERNKNKVMITEAGTEIIAQAQQVIDGVSKIQEFAKSNANPLAKPLKIGAIHTVGPYLFPKLITILHHTAPEMKLIIEEGFTSTLDEKLNAGELDAIILAKPFNKPNITIIELYQESLDLIIPARHSWREKTAIDPNSLDQQ
ncbi:MAG: LysR family transcriptional regulator, partial [Burkholderiales bacterium]